MKERYKELPEDTGSEEIALVSGPVGARRKTAVLHYLNRARTEFAGCGLDEDSIAGNFIRDEFQPVWGYNDIEETIALGASLWILDKLKREDKIAEADDILHQACAYENDIMLPINFYHPCFDNDLIKAMVTMLNDRYPRYGGVINEGNAKGEKPDSDYLALLSLLPEEDVETAGEYFREKIWNIASCYMKGCGYYTQEMYKLSEYYGPVCCRDTQGGPLMDKLPPEGIFDFKRSLRGAARQRQNERDEAKERYNALKAKEEKFYRNFNTYLRMEKDDRKKIQNEIGSKDLAVALSEFTLRDPYEICFALYYLLDTGNDAPWLLNSGISLLSCAACMLPWYADTRDWGDEEWEKWMDPLTYNRNGWTGKEPPPGIDYYHERHMGKNLAQVVYELSGCIVPAGLYPFEEDRARLVSEGMAEETAREVTGTAGLLFLCSFRSMPLDMDYIDDTEDDEYDEDYEDDVWWPEQLEENEEPEGNEEASSLNEEETKQLREELKSLRRQLKTANGALAAAKKENAKEREKYEKELKSLRMEHRELADLRDLIFNKDRDDVQRREKLEEDFTYPYTTRKRTVVFGGHETFLKIIKPMLPTVRFVDAANLAFSPDIIRYADVVWIQNNRISHPQFWNVVKYCKLSGVQMRYFGYASAEKCAEQLVKEDMKG